MHNALKHRRNLFSENSEQDVILYLYKTILSYTKLIQLAKYSVEWTLLDTAVLDAFVRLF